MDAKRSFGLVGVIIGASSVYLWGSLSLFNARATVIILPDAHAAVSDQASVALSTVSVLTPTIGLPPIMQRIAGCESTGDASGTPREFNSNGSILWGNDSQGKVIKRDCGEFQINTWVWGRNPQKQDVCESQSANISFAMSLYSKYGTSPWNASKSCWN